MPKPKQQPVKPVAVDLPMAEIQKHTAKQAAEQYAQRATIQQRAFAEMGKLHYHLSSKLTKGQTIYVELRKHGIKNSTISNASYASKVFDLVAAGHLTEAEFDTFTFADCYAICRATGEKSARRLTGDDVAVLVRAKPDNFDEELNSIFETGLTVEEAEAQAKKAEADAKAATAAAQAAAVQAAADAAAKKAKEEAEAAAAQAAQAAAQAASEAAAAAAAVTAQTPSAPPADPASAPIAPAVDSTPVPSSTPAPEAPASTPSIGSTASTDPAPANVVQMPSDPDAALPQVLSAVDELLDAVSEMSVEARTKVFAKLHEALEVLSENLPGESAVA
jgi:hypothetical protein